MHFGGDVGNPDVGIPQLRLAPIDQPDTCAAERLQVVVGANADAIVPEGRRWVAGLLATCPVPAGLFGPNALSALLALKHMSDHSAFRFHDRFEKREFSCAEAAVVV